MVRDRLMCLMVLVVSGNPAIGYFYTPAVIVLSAAILLAVALFRKVSITPHDRNILLLFMAIFLVHLITFGLTSLIPSASFMLKLLIALLALRSIPCFDRRLVEVMVGLSFVSLIFFVPVLTGIDMAQILEPFAIPFEQNNIQPMIHIGIHNYRVEVGGLNRNSGMFWEPGAFAGYLIFAMMLTLTVKSRLSTLYFWVLGITLLSTQSTTGYIGLVIVLVGYLIASGDRLSSSLKNTYRFTLLTVLAIGAISTYSHLPFLKDKIIGQMIYTENEDTYWQLTRFGNAIFDIEYIIERPILGWSLSDQTRDVDDEFILTAQGNGLTGAMVRLGMTGVIIYFVLVYTGFKKRFKKRTSAIIATVCIATLLVGEQFLLYPLFLVLMFAPRENIRLPLSRGGIEREAG